MARLVEAWRRFSMHPAVRPLTERRIVLQWRLAGRPVPPPPSVKHAIVKDYQRRFGPRVFVETGTFAGGMIDAVRDRFDRVISIELDPGWHGRAVERFRADPRVTLLLGDSGVRLKEVLGSLREPALFWLDAHYSGPVTARGAIDSPIVGELEAIRAHPVAGHVVLIDDMRDFNGLAGYPTVDALAAWIGNADPAAHVVVRDDVLRWHPAVP
ncbi:MAG TPA: hypothetical protein VF921_01915 [Vicinamibacterales bacterium]